jgi:hypothetical protein
MKTTGRLMAALESEKGDFWQVALTLEEQLTVLDLIQQLHDGTVKLLRNKLPIHLKQYEQSNKKNPCLSRKTKHRTDQISV